MQPAGSACQAEARARKDRGLGLRAEPEELLGDQPFISSGEHELLRTNALLGVPRDGDLPCLFVHALTVHPFT